jgi:hypothetical protein
VKASKQGTKSHKGPCSATARARPSYSRTQPPLHLLRQPYPARASAGAPCRSDVAACHPSSRWPRAVQVRRCASHVARTPLCALPERVALASQGAASRALLRAALVAASAAAAARLARRLRRGPRVRQGRRQGRRQRCVRPAQLPAQRCPDALPKAQVAASRGAKMTTSRRRAPHPQARRSSTSAASKGAHLRRRSPHFSACLTTAAAFSRSKFDAALDALRRELGKLRTGRASPGARLRAAATAAAH